MTRRLVFNLFWLSVVLSGGFVGAQAEPMTSVALEVSGGKHAGSYAQASPDTSCTLGSGEADSWSATLGTDTPEPEGLSIFMLEIPHLEPSATGITNFSLFAGFGDYGGDDYTEYILQPEQNKGSGTLTLTQQDRKHVLVEVSGVTAEGVELGATLTCNDMLDMSGKSLSAGEFGELDFAPDADAPTGSLSLVIGDSSYERQTSEESTCRRDVGSVGDFWYEYYVGGNSTGLLIITSDLEGAKDGTTMFGFSIDLSPVHEPGDLGTLTATQDGDRLTLVMDTQTVDGTTVKATVVCAFP